MGELNENRRRLIKIILVGGVTLAVGKILSPWLADLFSNATTENNFANFRTEESKKELKVFDKTGEEIFVIDDNKD